MRYDDLTQFLRKGAKALAKGPVALLFFEDDVEVESTLRHHIAREFNAVLVFSNTALTLPQDLGAQVHHVMTDMMQPDLISTTLNRVIAAAPGVWMYYGHNAEYLFHPFCESRSVGELTAFVNEERRASVLCFVVDAYAKDLEAHPGAVSLEDAHIDKAGYYALARMDEWNNTIDRQMDFHGGLRWRFEEHIPQDKRRIDRPALFRAREGLVMNPNHLFNDPEYNTFSCPWHHSPTAAVVSFRAAKALRRNPGSRFDIEKFHWQNSESFTWHSQQLLDLGLMEPGQWF